MIQLVRSGTLAGMGGIAMTHDDVISLHTLSRLGGVRSQCSDWLFVTLQLPAPPMSVLVHTVVSSQEGERLYIRSVFDWCGQFRDWVTDLRRSSTSPSLSEQLWSCAELTTGFGRGVASGYRL